MSQNEAKLVSLRKSAHFGLKRSFLEREIIRKKMAHSQDVGSSFLRKITFACLYTDHSHDLLALYHKLHYLKDTICNQNKD